MMNPSSRSPRRTLFPFCGSFFLFVILGPIAAQSATYYVATTGNDSNPGTLSSPWRNPQKCVDSGSPLVGGDVCEIANGTYTSTTTGRVVATIGATAPAGQPGKPITIRAANPSGAHILIPNSWPGVDCNVDFCPFSGFYITRPYYVIEGFEITRPGSFMGTKASVHGIDLEVGSDGSIVRRNRLHDIGRNICSDAVFGITGMSVVSGNLIIEENVFFTIGRLRDGENDCTTVRYQNDHGVYARATTNLTIRRNVFYDINRGFPIQIFKSGGGVTKNLNIYHNTFSGKSPTGLPAGHILLANTINGANIKNNISCNAHGGIVIPYLLTASDVVVSFNLSDTLERVSSISIPGVTFSNNIQQGTNLSFINESANNFRLTSRSPAINRGTTVGVPAVADGKPDIGAYEFSQEESSSPPRIPVGLSIQ
ncbi:MAG: right-handed parallel beta-helix repeat-containing protein [Nitrospira sp.]|nr:right-handed parallel beta-helix repeat-containing protein [Nitrospira sp.]